MALRTRRSAGVPVSRRVHLHIRIADRARDLRDLATAARAYKEAINLDPSLYHIWVQLGHVLKDAGRLKAASEAYGAAARLRAVSGEPYLFEAQVAKARGDIAAAATNYLEAIARGFAVSDATEQLCGLLDWGEPPATSSLRRVAQRLAPPHAMRGEHLGGIQGRTHDASAWSAEPTASVPGTSLDSLQTYLLEARICSPDAPAPGRHIAFDISDLVSHVRTQRLPTGIQRVQIEVVAAAIGRFPHHGFTICCFRQSRSDFVALEPALFMKLAMLSSELEGPSEAWDEVRLELVIAIAIAETLRFPAGAALVNLGTSWWLHNYFLAVRDAKERHGIMYVPFVHDVIPLMVPEHVVEGVALDYARWAVGAFDHADFFIANSAATARDLVATAATMGRGDVSASVEVVRLDAAFPRSNHSASPDRLEAFGLRPNGYVLFVSTIESRKNHVLALEAWRELLSRRGREGVPTLACVGRNGWLNGEVAEFIHSWPQVARKVRFVERVSDHELGLLYEQCLFIIYPSHYEGWGLPVTEALCHGKVPVVADNSSLPEAAAGFGILFKAGLAGRLADAVEELITKPHAIARLERAIADGYSPRTWTMLAEQIVDLAARPITSRPAPIPILSAGNYYPTRLFSRRFVWPGAASGEVVRTGLGWAPPEADGCALLWEGGRIRFKADIHRLRIFLRIGETAGVRHCLRIEQNGCVIAEARLRSREVRWLAFDLDSGAMGLVEMTLRPITMSVGENAFNPPDPAAATMKLLGIAFCDRNDDDRRARLILDLASLSDQDDTFNIPIAFPDTH